MLRILTRLIAIKRYERLAMPSPGRLGLRFLRCLQYADDSTGTLQLYCGHQTAARLDYDRTIAAQVSIQQAIVG